MLSRDRWHEYSGRVLCIPEEDEKMSTLDTKLLEKIQKLLSLATSPNEHEAKLAAEKANELLIRHNLSLSDLTVGESLSERYDNKPVYEGKVMSFETKWVMQLMNSHFFVQPIYRSARKVPHNPKLNRPAHIWFVGTKTNVEVASYVFQFLCQKYKQLWKEYQTQTGAHNHLKGSYYEGLTHGIHTQLSAKRKQVETSMALVVQQDPNLRKAVDQYHGRIRSSSGPNPMVDDQGVRNDGYVQGERLNISRGLTQNGGSNGLALDHKK
jgi:hypothetical protein